MARWRSHDASPDSQAAEGKETLTRSQLRNRQRKHTRRCLQQALSFARRSRPVGIAVQAGDLEEFRKSLYTVPAQQAQAAPCEASGYTCSWCTVWQPLPPSVEGLRGEEQPGCPAALSSCVVQSLAEELKSCAEPQRSSTEQSLVGLVATDTGAVSPAAGVQPSPCGEQRAGGTDATDTLTGQELQTTAFCAPAVSGNVPPQEEVEKQPLEESPGKLAEGPLVEPAVNVFSSQWWSQVVTKPTQVAPEPEVSQRPARGQPDFSQRSARGQPGQSDLVVYRKVAMSLQSLSGTPLSLGKPSPHCPTSSMSALPAFWTAQAEKKPNTDGSDGRVESWVREYVARRAPQEQSSIVADDFCNHPRFAE